MTGEQKPQNPATYAARAMSGSRVEAVADWLAAEREEVLGRWLQAARAQPFHRARPQDAVADHLPPLFDALVDLLRRYASGRAVPGDALKDPAVLAAARAHAAARDRQGLDSTAIVTEFRLLRREIQRALRKSSDDGVRATDVLGTEPLVHDALDGAVLLALGTLTENAATESRRPARREEAVPQSADLLRLLVERVEDYAIFLLDPEGRIASWNAGAEPIKGYAAEEIMGLPYATFFTEEDRATGKPEHLLRRARIDGRVEDEGWRMRKDGSCFWADAVLTALYGAHGHLRGYAKVTRNLTEHRQAEEQRLLSTALREMADQLAEERERFAAIFSQATAGIAQTDLDGRYVLVNDRWCELLGRPREELLTLRMQDITHPDDLPGNFALFERMRATGEGFTIEKRCVRPDGAAVWVNSTVSLVRDADGAPRFVLVVSNGLTERQRAEAGLRLRWDLIYAAHQAIFAWDLHDGITFWNRGAEELYGYSAAEAQGRRSHDLLGTPPEQVAALEAALQHEGRWEGELSHVSRDGRRRTVEARLALVGGDRRGYVVEAARDVTEKRRADAALRESEARGRSWPRRAACSGRRSTTRRRWRTSPNSPYRTSATGARSTCATRAARCASWRWLTWIPPKCGSLTSCKSATRRSRASTRGRRTSCARASPSWCPNPRRLP